MKSSRIIKREILPNQIFISLASIAGLFVSIYALVIEYATESSTEYKPMCDINQYISCSAPLTSQYGKGFGVLPTWMALRNPYFGIAFYTTVLTLSWFPPGHLTSKILAILAFTSNLMSIYLGSILLFVIQSLCLVCFTTYIINFLLLLFAIRYRSAVSRYLETLTKYDQ